MNRSSTLLFRRFSIILGFLTITLIGNAQKQTKTYTESFAVGKEAILDINTNYADIAFETWNQNKVVVTATFELEGATEQEANAYYERTPIEILGNSKKVSIISKSQGIGLFSSREFNVDFGDLDFDIPDVSAFTVEIPEIGPLPEMIEMPPLPMTGAFRFDYDAYKKDGEAYMKNWQKNFERSFDKEHQKRLEKWVEKMEKRATKLQQQAEEREEKMEAYETRRNELVEKRTEALQEKMEAFAERRSELFEKRAELLQNRTAALDSLLTQTDAHSLFFRRDSIISPPTIFYSSSSDGKKKYKVKKTIKVKMPKGMRIQMNVRHGEVRLAENTKNLNATLSYASLWGTSIDGNETKISASYTPVSVQKWSQGQLHANYSRSVALAEVMNLRLSATSSDVTIDELLGKAFIKNDFGPLVIKSVENSFEELDVSLKNGELHLSLPNSPTAIYLKRTNSELSLPKGLLLTDTKNGNTFVHKGNHLGEGGGAIQITAEYSDIAIR
ncbi:hypothetical protein ACFQZJ_06220 [Maribacter chungangensis]|uniref:DUF4097 domain-containing protein n=1 Tax=Maribacter chungangensis TaxID=1069117 RepID=A0ABW3B173_9FLAO